MFNTRVFRRLIFSFIISQSIILFNLKIVSLDGIQLSTVKNTDLSRNSKQQGCINFEGDVKQNGDGHFNFFVFL